MLAGMCCSLDTRLTIATADVVTKVQFLCFFVWCCCFCRDFMWSVRVDIEWMKNVMQGGIYIVELIDKFTLAFPLLIIVLLELVVISYVYGTSTHILKLCAL